MDIRFILFLNPIIIVNIVVDKDLNMFLTICEKRNQRELTLALLKRII